MKKSSWRYRKALDGQQRAATALTIGEIRFDGIWDKPSADLHVQKTYSLIQQLQPAALIIPSECPFTTETGLALIELAA